MVGILIQLINIGTALRVSEIRNLWEKSKKIIRTISNWPSESRGIRHLYWLLFDGISSSKKFDIRRLTLKTFDITHNYNSNYTWLNLPYIWSNCNCLLLLNFVVFQQYFVNIASQWQIPTTNIFWYSLAQKRNIYYLLKVFAGATSRTQ